MELIFPINTKQAAKYLKRAWRTVKLHCKKHGVRKFGRDYLIGEEDLVTLQDSIGDRPGPKPLNEN